MITVTKSATRVTTEWGHDTDPVAGGYRFHRALDTASVDKVVQVPYPCPKVAIEDPASASFGTLVRLIYHGFEVRIAHCNPIDVNFKTLVRDNGKVEAGTVIGGEGSVGKSTGPHCHIELVFDPDHEYHPELTVRPPFTWARQKLLKYEASTDSVKEFSMWARTFGVSEIGPDTLKAWDWRRNKEMVWANPALFSFKEIIVGNDDPTIVSLPQKPHKDSVLAKASKWFGLS